jgi:hypothetical protein
MTRNQIEYSRRRSTDISVTSVCRMLHPINSGSGHSNSRRRMALVTKGMNDKKACLIIPDIHHKIELVERIRVNHPGMPAIFLDEYFNDFDDADLFAGVETMNRLISTPVILRFRAMGSLVLIDRTTACLT